MTHQPEPIRELASLAVNAGRALQDEKRHYEIAFQENARLRAALERIHQMTDYWEQHLPEVIRTPAVVSALRAAMERAEPVAVSAAVAPPTDRAAVLREAISAVRDGDLGPRDGTSRDYEDGWWNSRAAAEQRIRSLADTSTQPVTVVSHRLPMSEQLAEEMNEGSSLIQQWAARAVAEPVDRAAVLPPAATCSAQYHAPGEDQARLCIRAAQHQRTAHTDEHGFHWSDTVATYPVADGTFRTGTNVRAALRRMADETATETPAAHATHPCNAATMHRLGNQATAHSPHLWVMQPGMEPVRCPGTRKPAAGARQDEPPTPSLRDQHRAAWHALTPAEQTARLAELDGDQERP